MAVYNYTKWKNSSVDVSTLDALIKLVLAPTTSRVEMIFKGLQLLILSIALIARKRLLDQELLLHKEEYQSDRSVGNQREVDNF